MFGLLVARRQFEKDEVAGEIKERENGGEED